MRFSDQFLDEIRERLPISSVVGQFVAWDKRKSQPGRGDFWACCPFHGEKTPSFHADDRRGRYHCFGCGVSGDHFRFLTDKAGMSFPEAVEQLAQQAGVPMPARDEREEKKQRARNTLYDVMELATRYFEEALAANIGARTRGYLMERGVAPKMQRRFRLGFAPDSRNGLKEYLASNGVSAAQMAACGLVIEREDVAVPYDRFRNRLMFPILDIRGRVIAFGGRAMADDMPAKYLNSPETDLFSKRRVLYNGQTARQAAHDGKPLIVVEGYMDVIALVSAGFEGAVAPLGTAMTEEHVEILWRMSEMPYLAFDGDEAGQRAAARAADMVLPKLQPGHSVRLITLPPGQDPDDLIKAGGRDAFAGLLETAQPLAEAVWARETRSTVFETPEARAALEAKLKGIAQQIGDQSVRRHYLQAFEEKLREFFRPQRRDYGGGGRHDGRYDGRGRGDYRGQGRGPGAPGGRGAPRYTISESLKKTRHLRDHVTPQAVIPREAAIVVTLVNHPGLAEARLESLAHLDLVSSAGKKVLAAVIDAVGSLEAPDPKAIRDQLERRGLNEALEAMENVVTRERIWQAGPDINEIDAEIGLKHALALHNKKVQLNRELRAAELALGEDPSEESLARLRDIQNQISSVDGTEALIEKFGSLSGRTARSF